MPKHHTYQPTKAELEEPITINTTPEELARAAVAPDVSAKRPKVPLKVIAGAPGRPLVIGNIEIECYVLEDETRVLSQGGFLLAIGRSRTPTAGKGGVDKTPAFLAANNLKPLVSNELLSSTRPIVFRPPDRGQAHGYDARLLPQVCEVYLKARDAGVLLPSQRHIAERADIVMRGLATVGVVALVDEATGYQEIRSQRALATILEKFIARELQPWTRTFPYEFYQQIFRLKGWPGPQGVKRPSVIGHYTNDVVYARLAPGVLDELRNKNPVKPSGRRRAMHHQWFTPDIGNPKLKEHLAAVIALMRAAANWSSFQRMLNRAFPKEGQNIPLPLEDE